MSGLFMRLSHPKIPRKIRKTYSPERGKIHDLHLENMFMKMAQSSDIVNSFMRDCFIWVFVQRILCKI